MLFSSIVNKDIYDDNTCLGKIQQVCWQKGARCQIVTDNKTFYCEKISIKSDRISVKEVNVCVQNSPQVIGKRLFDNFGNDLGEICDAQLSCTAKLQKITLKNGAQINVGRIVANNDVVIVRKKMPTKRCKKRSPQKEITPKRKYGDFSFLMGKRVDKTIKNFAGEIMIKQGQIITREIYIQAKRFGKLTELCLHIE